MRQVILAFIAIALGFVVLATAMHADMDSVPVQSAQRSPVN